MSVLTGVVFFKLFRSGVGDQSHLSNFPMCKESTFNTLFDLILSMRWVIVFISFLYIKLKLKDVLSPQSKAADLGAKAMYSAQFHLLPLYHASIF